MIRLGAHFSISKGLHNALHEANNYDCNALQIFTKNSQTWKERTVSDKEVALFHKTKEEFGITEIASHTSYLINLAAPDTKKHEMSCHALKQELIRSSMLGIPYVVLHPGSHMGKGETQGIQRIAESINQILEQISEQVFSEMSELHTRLLLETTAGQGTGIGHTFEQLAAIMDQVENKDKLGICLDTCHIFAAGYDIRTEKTYHETTAQFDSILGIKNLCLIHLNDSKKELGSRVDRHEHIGEGCIGINAFRYIMNDQRLCNIPKILETPKGKDWDQKNLAKLREIMNSSQK